MSALSYALLCAAFVAAAPFVGMAFRGFAPLRSLAEDFSAPPDSDGGLEPLFASLSLVFSILALVLIALRQDLLLIVFIAIFSDVAASAAFLHSGSDEGVKRGLELLFRTAAYSPVFILFAYSCNIAGGSFMISDIMGANVIGRIPAVYVAFLIASAFKRGIPESARNESHGALYPCLNRLSRTSRISYVLAKQNETVSVVLLCFVAWPDPPLASLLSSALFIAAADAAGSFIRPASLSGFIKFFWSAAFILCFGNVLLLMLGKI